MGLLKDLKTDIASSEESFKTNRHELNIPNVTSIGFTRDENNLIICTGSELRIAPVPDYTKLSTTDFKTITLNGEIDFFTASPTNPSIIAVLTTDSSLCILNLATQSQSIISTQVLNFSWSPKGKQIAVANLDGSINQITLAGERKVTIQRPEELSEENLLPLSIVWLSSFKFFVVYGEVPQDEEEDPSYDFKTFIITHDKSAGKDIFQENFDAIPAFGSVLRKPTVYSSTFHNLSNAFPILTVTASSTSVEITGISESEIILPELDQARAALPINDDTGNDINAIGLITDISTTGKIEEPCVGVSEADWLPSVWVLGNDGKIQGWYVFHVHDLKNGSLKPDGVEQYDDELYKAALGGNVPVDSPAKAPIAPSAQEEKKPFMFGQSNVQTGNKPVFGATTSTDKPPAFGSAGFGSSGFGSTENKPAFGSSGFGSSGFGQSSTNKAAFGSSGFGQSSFGSGKPAFGSSGFNQSTTGESPFSAFGKPDDKKTDSPFAFGSSAPKTESPFSGVGKKDEQKVDSPFASLGLNNEGKEDDKKSDSPFAFGSSAPKSDSPFASLGLNSETKSESPFGGLSNNQTSASFGASSGETKSVFDQSKETPASSLIGDANKNNENKPSALASMTQDLGGTLFGAANEPSKIKVPGLSDDEDENPEQSDSDNDSEDEQPIITKEATAPIALQSQPQPSGPTSFGNVAFGSKPSGSGFGSTGFGSTGAAASSGFGSTGFGNTGFKFGQQPQKPINNEPKEEKKVEAPKLGGFGQFANDNKLSALSKNKNVFEDAATKIDDTFKGTETAKEDTKPLEKPATDSSTKPEKEEQKESKPLDKPVTAPSATPEKEKPEIEKSNQSTQKPESESVKESNVSKSEEKKEDPIDDFAKFDEEVDKEWTDSDEVETDNAAGEEDEESDQDEDEGEAQDDEGDKNDTTAFADSSFDQSELNNTLQDETDELGDDFNKELILHEKPQDQATEQLGEQVDKNLNIDDKSSESKEDIGFEHVKAEDGKDSSSFDSLNDIEEENLYEEVKGQNVKYDGADRVERNIQAEPIEMHDAETQTFIPTSDVGVSAIVELQDVSTQTEVVETKSIALRTFEDDEAYFSSFFVPPEVPAYQHLGQVKYPKLSSDPIFSQLEKIYYDTQAEISIIEENCQKIGGFIDEHLKEEPIHTEKSIANAHHWRLSEAGTVNKLIHEKAQDSIELKDQLCSQHSKFKTVQDTILSLEKQASRMREKIFALEKLTDKAILNARDLPVEVLILQDKIRKKYSKVADDLRTSEQKIMSLKTATNIFYNDPPTPAALHAVINHINSVTRDYSRDTKQLTEQIAKLNVNHTKILEQLNEGKTKSFKKSEWENRSITKMKVEDLSKRLNAKRAINEALRQRSASSITVNFK